MTNKNNDRERERAEDLRAYKEAMFYVENARRLIEKAERFDRDYRNRKYVRLCGHALHHAMLRVLDRIYRKAGLPGLPKGVRKSQEYYRYHADQLDEALAKRWPNCRRLREDIEDIDHAYYFAHLVLGYDGIGSKYAVDAAFYYILRVIKRLAPRAVRIPKVEQPKAFPVAKRPPHLPHACLYNSPPPSAKGGVGG